MRLPRKKLLRGERERLPNRRASDRQKVTVGDTSIYLDVGRYEDGRVAEIFLNVSKLGTIERSMMEAFAILLSTALQYGMPLEAVVDRFVFTAFEPNGVVTGHDRIKMATSILDYVFRQLAIEDLGREDLAHVWPT